MKQKVYLETTVPSYLAARPSRDLVIAGNQELTHEWWAERRKVFDLYVSQFVLDEAMDGDADAAHIAVATVHQMDFLLTWNCKHIANAQMLGKIYSVCETAGYKCPLVCTPAELMEG